MKDKRETKITSPEFRASFVNVFVPRTDDGGKVKYGLTMLIPKGSDLTPYRKAYEDAIWNKWGDAPPKNAAGKLAIRSPFNDGDKKDFDGYHGHWYVSATSTERPGVVDQRVQPIIEPGAFYSGCYARATLRAYAYDKAGNAGVAFGLQNVQKMREGEPFGSKKAAKDDFTAVSIPPGSKPGNVVVSDPMGGTEPEEFGDLGDDEVPF